MSTYATILVLTYSIFEEIFYTALFTFEMKFIALHTFLKNNLKH